MNALSVSVNSFCVWRFCSYTRIQIKIINKYIHKAVIIVVKYFNFFSSRLVWFGLWCWCCRCAFISFGVFINMQTSYQLPVHKGMKMNEWMLWRCFNMPSSIDIQSVHAVTFIFCSRFRVFGLVSCVSVSVPFILYFNNFTSWFLVFCLIIPGLCG